MSRAPRPRLAWTLLPLALLAAGCASPPEWPDSRITVRGLVSFTKDGRTELVECGTRRTFALGAMDGGHFLRLRRRVEDLSRPGHKPVTAEVSGYFARDGRGRAIEKPALLWVAAGRCVEYDDRAADYD